MEQSKAASSMQEQPQLAKPKTAERSSAKAQIEALKADLAKSEAKNTQLRNTLELLRQKAATTNELLNQYKSLQAKFAAAEEQLAAERSARQALEKAANHPTAQAPASASQPREQAPDKDLASAVAELAGLKKQLQQEQALRQKAQQQLQEAQQRQAREAAAPAPAVGTAAAHKAEARAQRAESEAQRHKAQVQALQQQLAQLQQQKSASATKASAAQQQQLTAELEEHKRKVGALTARLTELQGQLSAARAASQELNKEVAAAHAARQRLEQQLAAAEQARQQASSRDAAQVQLLQMQMREERSARAALEQRLQEARKGKEHALKELEEMKGQVMELQAQVRGLDKRQSQDSRSLQEQLTEANRTISALCSEVRKFKRAFSAMASLGGDAQAPHDTVGGHGFGTLPLGQQARPLDMGLAPAPAFQLHAQQQPLTTAQHNTFEGDGAARHGRLAHVPWQQQQQQQQQLEGMHGMGTRAGTAHAAGRGGGLGVQHPRAHVPVARRSSQSTQDMSSAGMADETAGAVPMHLVSSNGGGGMGMMGEDGDYDTEHVPHEQTTASGGFSDDDSSIENDRTEHRSQRGSSSGDESDDDGDDEVPRGHVQQQGRHILGPRTTGLGFHDLPLSHVATRAAQIPRMMHAAGDEEQYDQDQDMLLSPYEEDQAGVHSQEEHEEQPGRLPLTEQDVQEQEGMADPPSPKRRRMAAAHAQPAAGASPAAGTKPPGAAQLPAQPYLPPLLPPPAEVQDLFESPFPVHPNRAPAQRLPCQPSQPPQRVLPPAIPPSIPAAPPPAVVAAPVSFSPAAAAAPTAAPTAAAAAAAAARYHAAAARRQAAAAGALEKRGRGRPVKARDPKTLLEAITQAKIKVADRKISAAAKRMSLALLTRACPREAVLAALETAILECAAPRVQIRELEDLLLADAGKQGKEGQEEGLPMWMGWCKEEAVNKNTVGCLVLAALEADILVAAGRTPGRQKKRKADAAASSDVDSGSGGEDVDGADSQDERQSPGAAPRQFLEGGAMVPELLQRLKAQVCMHGRSAAAAAAAQQAEHLLGPLMTERCALAAAYALFCKASGNAQEFQGLLVDVLALCIGPTGAQNSLLLAPLYAAVSAWPEALTLPASDAEGRSRNPLKTGVLWALSSALHESLSAPAPEAQAAVGGFHPRVRTALTAQASLSSTPSAVHDDWLARLLMQCLLHVVESMAGKHEGDGRDVVDEDGLTDGGPGLDLSSLTFEACSGQVLGVVQWCLTQAASSGAAAPDEGHAASGANVQVLYKLASGVLALVCRRAGLGSAYEQVVRCLMAWMPESSPLKQYALVQLMSDVITGCLAGTVATGEELSAVSHVCEVMVSWLSTSPQVPGEQTLHAEVQHELAAAVVACSAAAAAAAGSAAGAGVLQQQQAVMARLRAWVRSGSFNAKLMRPAAMRLLQLGGVVPNM